MTTTTIHEMDEMGAWSEDGEAWLPRSKYPTRSAAMQQFSKVTSIPFIEVRCYARHARHAPDDPAAEFYGGEYWVECPADAPGAFPVWRCE